MSERININDPTAHCKLSGLIYKIKIGEIVEVDFVMEFLQENNFERIDFVYEPGQLAIRGGIVDVYSFAHELPYRIELNGNKIESIRSFDPSTQLSEQQIGFVTIIPNIQSGMVKEEHESFFDFIPKNTVIYGKDLAYTIRAIEASLKKVAENYGVNSTIKFFSKWRIKLGASSNNSFTFLIT